MTKIKEKKLNAIKSEIEEITNFIKTSRDESVLEHDNPINKNDDDTFTLTDIVDKEFKQNNNSDLEYIRNELKSLNSTLANHENLLREILLKIK